MWFDGYAPQIPHLRYSHVYRFSTNIFDYQPMANTLLVSSARSSFLVLLLTFANSPALRCGLCWSGSWSPRLDNACFLGIFSRRNK